MLKHIVMDKHSESVLSYKVNLTRQMASTDVK